jgi:hypothetical protein
MSERVAREAGADSRMRIAVTMYFRQVVEPRLRPWPSLIRKSGQKIIRHEVATQSIKAHLLFLFPHDVYQSPHKMSSS